LRNWYVKTGYCKNNWYVKTGIVKISGMKFQGIFLNVYNWDGINGVKSVK
jgi:hypothetical protein